MQFLEFLKKRGEGDLRDWLIDEGMAEAFAGEKGAEMRQWLRSLGSEDKKLAVRIGFSAGEGLLGDEGGLKGYLDTFTDVARAWETAGKVEDLDRRIEAATPVYQAWAGRDPQGAKLAWELMFGK